MISSLLQEPSHLISALLAVLAASLSGSLHCVAMCGPIALVAGGKSKAQAAWYHVGRLMGYLTLGALAGKLGSAVLSGSNITSLQNFLGWILAAMLVLVGLSVFKKGMVTPPWPKRLQILVLDGLKRSLARPPLARNLSIGLLSVFLPCGWLYTFVLASIGSGSAMTGALVLFVFWLGTLPIFVAGTAISKLTWLRLTDSSRLRQGVGVLMVLLGLNSIHLHLKHASSASADRGSAAEAEEQHHCH